MPEVYFHVRWPDGVSRRFYSPSTVIEEHLRTGGRYRIGDFLERTRAALVVASERVAAVHGFPCGRAAATVVALDDLATDLPADAAVLVERFDR
ncbi:putative repeat protein (TIGR04042 family) [Prauserella isguenensis]|uniref:Putative repeat protein (TIGR04042 family) n=1 Tax=Prauserella isguenensis TaxID=1470180 RepID=A0A839S1V9_9PSEU|nr:putative repeat protein (TIGR04042 family) [Prauserella isguenensis]